MEMLLTLHHTQTTAAHGTFADVVVDNQLPWRQQETSKTSPICQREEVQLERKG